GTNFTSIWTRSPGYLAGFFLFVYTLNHNFLCSLHLLIFDIFGPITHAHDNGIYAVSYQALLQCAGLDESRAFCFCLLKTQLYHHISFSSAVLAGGWYDTFWLLLRCYYVLSHIQLPFDEISSLLL